jgi:hypothetical protein
MNVAAEGQPAVEVPADVPVYSIRDSWRFAALLFAIDGICLGQFGFAVLLFGWTVLVRIPMIALAWKDKPLRVFRIKKVALYLLAVVGIMALFMFNRQVGTQRADDLVKAVEAYSAKHGQFPQNLEQVVPDFMSSIPLARYTLASNDFSYRTGPDGKHVLSWTAMPPLARRSYTFEEKRWVTIH